jgi:hypothetical protein
MTEKSLIFIEEFENAVNSLNSNRFSKDELKSLWKSLTKSNHASSIDKFLFRCHFDTLAFKGASSMKFEKGTGKTTLQTEGSKQRVWENDIFEKLRGLVKSSSQTLEQIFNDLDQDNNGVLSTLEFRGAMRKLGIGLTSKEIDKLMIKTDKNSDGVIDWEEFMSKFKPRENDQIIFDRTKTRLVKLKEMMYNYMVSPMDAFRMVLRRIIIFSMIKIEEANCLILTSANF